MATRTWTGLGDGVNWTDPLNWDGGVPTSADDAIIGAAALQTVSIPANAQAASLTVNGEAIRVESATGAAVGTMALSNGTVVFNSATPIVLAQAIVLSNNSILTANTPGGTASLTLGAGALVEGAGSILDNRFGFSGPVDLVNLGTIRANVANQTLAITTTSFSNQGLLEAVNGARLAIEENLNRAWSNTGTISGTNSTLFLSGPFNNSGQIVAVGGTLTLDGTFAFGGTATTWTNAGTITATNAAVNIAGNLTVGQIGALQRTGGSLTYTFGTLDNTGATLDAGTTSLLGVRFSGGTIKGGTLVQAGLGLTFDIDSRNTLDGVTVNGGLDVNTSGAVVLTGGTTVNNAAGTAPGVITVQSFGILSLRNAGPSTLNQTVNLASNSILTASNPNGAGSLVIGGAGVVQGTGRIAENVFPFSTTVDLDNTGTIRADIASQTLAITTTSFINHGLLEAVNGGRLAIEENQNRAWTNAAGATISQTNATLFLSGPFTNAGQITAVGGTLTLDGTFNFGGTATTWINTGTITATNAAVSIAGNETVAQIGALERSGGSLAYTFGTLDNTGGTLDASTTALIGMTLSGGTIRGGTLVQSGLGLTFDNDSRNTLDGVSVNGGLDVTASGAVVLTGGTTVNDATGTGPGIITVQPFGILSLRNAGPSTLNQTVNLVSNSILTASDTNGAASLVIGGAGVVQGSGRITENVFPFSTTVDLENTGTIRANVANQTLAITTTSFVNNGVLDVNNGARLAIEENQNRAWTNAAGGTILATNSTLLLSGPFTNAGQIVAVGGTLTLDGTFNFGSQLVTWLNTGTITASDAIVEVRGNEAGTGAMTLTGATTMFVRNGIGAGQTITLGPTSQIINLFQPLSFQAAIANFEQGDLIVLRGRSVDVVALAGNTLNLSFQGSAVASIALAGEFAGTTFAANPDGQGNTIVSIGAVNLPPLFNSFPIAQSFIETGAAILASGNIAFADPNPGDQASLQVTARVVTAAGAGLTLTAEQMQALQNGFGVSGTSGAWNFALPPEAVRFLTQGDSVEIEYTVTATDSFFASATQVETFTVDGSIEAPVFTSAAVNETLTETGSALSAAGTIEFSDFDRGDSATAAVTQRAVTPSAGLTLTPGQIAAFQNAFVLDPATGAWSFDLAAADSQFLGNGQSVEIAYTVAASDQHGATATQVERFRINGTSSGGSPPTINAPGVVSTFDSVAALLAPITIADPDVVATPVTVTIADTRGMLAAGAVGSAVVTGSGTRQLTISGTLAEVNAVLASLTYLVATTGQDTIEITVSDSDDAGQPRQIAVSTSELPHTLAVMHTPLQQDLYGDTPTVLNDLKVSDPFGELRGRPVTVTLHNPDGIFGSTGNNSMVTGRGTDTLTLTGTLAQINADLADPPFMEYTLGLFTATAPSIVVHGEVDVEKLPGFHEAKAFQLGVRSVQFQFDRLIAAITGGPEPSLAQYLLDVARIMAGLPHIVTAGGVAYDFNAAGEFVLAASKEPGSSFLVEVRLEPYQGGASMSAVTQAAAAIGNDKVTIEADRAATVWVSGAPAAIGIGAPIALAAGKIEQVAAHSYRLSWNTGESLIVTDTGTYLDLSLAFGPNAGKGTIAGLINSNTDGARAFELPDGTVLPQPLTTDQLYNLFGNAWRVPENLSLFDYEAGESPSTFNDPAFPRAVITLADLPANVVSDAAAAVAAAGITDPGAAAAATLDLIASGGDPAVLVSNVNALGNLAIVPATVTPSQPAPAVLGVDAPQDRVIANVAGPTEAQFTVYLTKAVATDTVVNWNVIAPTSDYLEAAAFGGTLPSGQITILAGATQGTITFDIPEDALGANPSEKLAVRIAAPGKTPVFAATALETIVAPPKAGPPAELELSLLTSLGKFTQSGNVYTLKLGSIGAGEPLPAIQFALANTAALGSDDIAGTFTVQPGVGFEILGASLPGPIDPGQSYQGLTVGLITGAFGSELPLKLGNNRSVIKFAPLDVNDSGYSAALPEIEIRIEYTLEPPRKVYSSAWGDVHIVTYNQTFINFQAVGEFTLAKSRLPDSTFDIQLRLEPAAFASVITQVAITVGTDRVTFDTKRPDLIWVNGSPLTSLSLAAPTIDLADGTLTMLTPNTFKVVWNSGEEMTLFDRTTHLDVVDAVLPTIPGFITGLQGQYQGNERDFQLPDGTVLQQPLPLDQLYGAYADGWRVTQATSLFDYEPGQTTETFTDRTFPLIHYKLTDLPADVVARARAQATEAGITDPTIRDAVALDLILTGNPGFIESGLAMQQAGLTNDKPVEPTQPGALPAGVGVAATAARVTESQSGPTSVQFQVYLTSAIGTDTTVQFQVLAPGLGFLDAADFGGTLPSGSLTIAAGETSGLFNVVLPAEVLGNDPTENLRVGIGAAGGPPVIAPTAETQIVNDDVVAGAPAIALLAQLAGRGTLTRDGNGYTLDLGTIARGEFVGLQQLAVVNAAVGDADLLGGIFGVPLGEGFVVSGNNLPGLIAPGGSYAGLYVTVDTDELGEYAGTLTFLPKDVNRSGFSADLAPLTFTILSSIVEPAAAALNTPDTIVFPNVRVGTELAQHVSITNTALAPALDLDVTPIVSGAATASGSIDDLAPGATDFTSLTVGLDTSAAGAISGYVNLVAASDSGSGTPVPITPYPIVDVFGSVYRTATAAIEPVARIVHVGDTGLAALRLANTAATDGYSEALIATLTATTGGITASGNGSTGPIAPGAVDAASLAVAFSTAQAGIISGTATLALTSYGGTGAGSINGLGTLALAPQSVAIDITVNNFAVAALRKVSGDGTLTGIGNAYTLDLGTFAQGAAPPAAVSLEVLNAADGPADFLLGTFEADLTGPFIAQLVSFNGVGAGAAAGIGTIALDTSTAGVFSQTIILKPVGFNASGYSAALADVTLTLLANIEAAPAPVVGDISIDDATLTEGTGGVPSTATFTVSRTGTVAFTVGFATGNGSATAPADYTAAAGTLAFAEGEASRTITVAIIPDALDEPDETFSVVLSNATGNGASILRGTGTGTIADDDPQPGLTIGDVTVAEGNSGTATAAFTVTLSAASGRTVTVAYATANGSATAPGDYTAASGTLTFAPGETSKTVSVAVVGDTIDEANETFFVNLSNAVNATITDTSGTGTILDDDEVAPPPGPKVITGTNKADCLFGSNGADLITALKGNDVVFAKDGDDIIVATRGDGNDDYYGDRGSDTIDFSQITRAIDVSLGGKHGGSGSAYSAETGRDCLVSIENVVGGQAGDCIDGSRSDNIIEGARGNDVMTGNGGNDTFVFKPGFGRDTICDFDANRTGGQDTLDIRAFGIDDAAEFAQRVTITDLGKDTRVVVDSDPNQAVLLTGVNGVGANVITIDDFRYL